MCRYEKEVQALQKEAKIYLDSMRGVSGASRKSGRELIYVFYVVSSYGFVAREDRGYD